MPRKLKLGALTGLGVLACAGIVLLAVPGWQGRAEGQDAAPPAGGGPVLAAPIPVEVTPALEVMEPQTRSFAGAVEALRTVDLAFQISGQLLEFPVIAGDFLPAGALIGSIDEVDFQLALDRARAAHDLARTELERATALSERGVAADARLDTARAEFAQAEVALREAERRLSQTRVRAPFDAIVARTFTEAFTNVTPAEPVVRLHDVSEMLIRISLPEDLAAAARVQPELFDVTATFPAAPGYRARLEPRSFAAEADPSTRTFDIEFRIVGEVDPRILPGMTAKVSVGERDNAATMRAVSVPVSAVDTTSRADPTVWIYDPETGTVTRRNVRIGLPRGSQIIVLEGLAAGELVVSAGWWRLREGMKVRVPGL
ncbi:MAG: efflux RND transporter periplasmic adaptor subunit [Roseovarius sp.]|nr:efflux RND transporter periplasmic adaptor subunit [Roseovarius sp.]